MITLLLHKHIYLFTDALTGIILWVYQAGWSVPVKKRWPALAQKWITQVRNWLAEGFKDVCVLHFCLFSLVLSTQGQSNSFSKVSKLHNLLEDILPTQGQNSHTKPWGRDAYKWENPQTDRKHHAFIGKKVIGWQVRHLKSTYNVSQSFIIIMVS